MPPVTIDTPLEQLLTTKQLCKRLNCGPRSLDGLGIPFIKFGRFKRFDPRGVEAWLTANKVDPDDIKVQQFPTFHEREGMRRSGSENGRATLP